MATQKVKAAVHTACRRPSSILSEQLLRSVWGRPPIYLSEQSFDPYSSAATGLTESTKPPAPRTARNALQLGRLRVARCKKDQIDWSTVDLKSGSKESPVCRRRASLLAKRCRAVRGREHLLCMTLLGFDFSGYAEVLNG